MKNSMKIRLLQSQLTSHALGAFVVSFAASAATLTLGLMARVEPEIFTTLTLCAGAIAFFFLALGALMTALLVFKLE